MKSARAVRPRSTFSKALKTKGRSAAPLLLPAVGDSKPYDIRERAFLFANRILEICARIPSTPEGFVVRQQLARCGTSVGANVEEANGAISQADRRKSFVVARKEAPAHRWPAQTGYESDIQKALEISRILTKLVRRLT
jgi:four helix bundle protein